MSDYGWWGEANYEYEPNETLLDKGAYGRIWSLIAVKGGEAGKQFVKNPNQAIENPYKRRDFADAWQAGFDSETAELQAAWEDKQYHEVMQWVNENIPF